MLVVTSLLWTSPTRLVVADSQPGLPPDLTGQASSFVVWVLVGLAFLWALSFMAETTMVKLRPVLMFMVVAAFVGVLVLRIFNSL